MKTWEYFDVTNTLPFFYLKNQQKFSTIYGAMSSFLGIITIFAISMYLVVDFFQGNQTTIIYGETTEYERKLDFRELPFMFQISSTLGDSIPNNIAYLIPVRLDFIPSQGGKPIIDILKYEKCNIDVHFGKYAEVFKNQNVENFYCLNRTANNLTIYGKKDDIINGFSSIGLFFCRCSNNSIYNPSPGKCADNVTITNQISSAPITIRFSILEFLIDNKIKKDPYIPTVTSINMPISEFLVYRWAILLSRSFLVNDDGFVFENLEFYNKPFIDEVSFDIYVNTTLAIKESTGKIGLFMANRGSQYQRSYLKLQVLIANVGGVIKAILTVIIFINYPLNNHYLMSELIDICIDQSEPSSQRNKNTSVLEILNSEKGM